MKWFLGIALSWAITIGTVTSYWGKFHLIQYVGKKKETVDAKHFAEMSARYEVMISAYKEMCFIRKTYDKEIEKLMGQIEIHRENMKKRANSREILAKALRERNKEFGIGGDDFLYEKPQKKVSKKTSKK